tara:strand:- start:1794 stop:2033 length:240 start_codon:yes stop_codon:yes gene_type:complete
MEPMSHRIDRGCHAARPRVTVVAACQHHLVDRGRRLDGVCGDCLADYSGCTSSGRPLRRRQEAARGRVALSKTFLGNVR